MGSILTFPRNRSGLAQDQSLTPRFQMLRKINFLEDSVQARAEAILHLLNIEQKPLYKSELFRNGLVAIHKLLDERLVCKMTTLDGVAYRLPSRA